jgi:protein-S-isoprenylcysteine O-methyltransferase Ste14
MPNPRLIASALLNTTVYGLLLFVPAGTVHWWRAWALLGVVFVGMIATRLWIFRDERDLLAERSKPPMQRGQPLVDKLLVIAFLIIFPAYLAFIPIDVFRLHLMARPAGLIPPLGLLLVVAGVCIVALAFRENTFAVSIVKHQGERGHAVIDSGVYSVVRHPLYSGVVLVLVGVALWLQSCAAAIISIVPIALILLRIGVEEAFLKARLVGYEAYTSRVRCRLVPRVW